jgi:hypothetical protein
MYFVTSLLSCIASFWHFAVHMEQPAEVGIENHVGRHRPCRA